MPFVLLEVCFACKKISKLKMKIKNCEWCFKKVVCNPVYFRIISCILSKCSVFCDNTMFLMVNQRGGKNAVI